MDGRKKGDSGLADRRVFLRAVGASLAAMSGTAFAQSAVKAARISYLSVGSQAKSGAFLQALRATRCAPWDTSCGTLAALPLKFEMPLAPHHG
jgi:hypothetical protein